MATPNPLETLSVTAHQIPAYKATPNTSLRHHPLLIYQSAYPSTATARSISAHLSSVGVVQPQWTYSMYSFSHFHSTTHEVLAVCSGAATLLFGCEDNGGKVLTCVRQGDVIVIPAGVAHRLLDETESGFQMVGSYPRDAAPWDMCTGKKGEEGVKDRIKELKWFDKDPVYGDDGPVLREGKANGSS